MLWWQAVILGLVQGVFMFFPVSSTSHLVLVQHWFKLRDEGFPDPDGEAMIFFNLMVHVGTLVSIVVIFRRPLLQWWSGLLADLGRMFGPEKQWRRWWGRLHFRLTTLCVVSVGITGVLGLSMKGPITRVFADPLLVALALAVTGLMLWQTDKSRGRRSLRAFGWREAVVIGLAQAFALVPGLSRSGLTIAFALFLGMRRRWAAEYSFLLAIPTIMAASLVQAVKVIRTDEWQQLGVMPYAIAFVVSAAAGCVALWLVLKLLYRARFRVFAIYVWVLAALVVWLRIG